MKKILNGIIALISFPLVLLNIIGGIAALIWLIVLGEWNAILLGILIMLIGAFVISFLLMPGLIFMLPISYFAEKNKVFGLAIFGFLNLLYTFAIIAISSYFIFYYITNSVGSEHMLPALIWSYAAATAPWSYMASKEEGARGEFNGTQSTLYFAELGLFVVVILLAFFHQTLVTSFYIFSGIMIVPLILSVSIVANVAINNKKLSIPNEKTCCINCGEEIFDEANFCKSCGTKIIKD